MLLLALWALVSVGLLVFGVSYVGVVGGYGVVVMIRGVGGSGVVVCTLLVFTFMSCYVVFVSLIMVMRVLLVYGMLSVVVLVV